MVEETGDMFSNAGYCNVRELEDMKYDARTTVLTSTCAIFNVRSVLNEALICRVLLRSVDIGYSRLT